MVRRHPSIYSRARIARGWSLGFYIAGIAAIGTGLLAGAIVAAATGSAAGFGVAAIVAATGAATGGVGLWESRRFRLRAESLERRVSERRLHALAEQHDGVLSATDVASALGVMRSEAEALLDHLVDEISVSMRVTDEGEIRYVFREAEAGGPTRIRVSVPDEPPGEAIEPETTPEGSSKERNH